MIYYTIEVRDETMRKFSAYYAYTGPNCILRRNESLLPSYKTQKIGFTMRLVNNVITYRRS